MKPEATATVATKLKLTIRNPRASPDSTQHTPAPVPERNAGNVHGNGQIAKNPQINGRTNGKLVHPVPTSAPKTSFAAKQQTAPEPTPKPVHPRSPIPTPPSIETREVKSEPNGIPRRSPGGTPKPTKVLPVPKSRTPALLPESESITVTPRLEHLSPPVREPSGRHSATPAVENARGAPSPAAQAINTPTPGPSEARATMSPAVQPNPQQNTGGHINGVDPRFRPPGKGIYRINRKKETFTGFLADSVTFRH